MKKKIINIKQTNKKIFFNKKNNQKKFQLYKNSKKQIIFQNNKNIINKKTIAFFKILKKKITEKKVKKKKNFKTKVVSFYKKIKSDQKRKIFIGAVNTIYKFARPTYMFDLDTTVFAPKKYINWHNRVFIENFDQEKKFYVKPSAFNRIMDKNFKNFSINDFISSKIDKKINKKSNIKKIYSDFYTNLKKITKRYPYGYIKKLHWKERFRFGKKITKERFVNFFWKIIPKVETKFFRKSIFNNYFKKFSLKKDIKRNKKKKIINSEIKKQKKIKNIKLKLFNIKKKIKNDSFTFKKKINKKKLFFFLNRKTIFIKLFKFVKKNYKVKFSIKSIKKFFENYPKYQSEKNKFIKIYKNSFKFFYDKIYTEKPKADKIFFDKLNFYENNIHQNWKLNYSRNLKFFKQKKEKNLESFLTFTGNCNIIKKNFKVHYPYKKRMNKKKNRKKMRHWKKKKNWIISFHSDTCFRKRRYKNNSNDQEKRFALNKLFRKHRYTTRFSPRHRVKANRIRVFCVNNLKWNSFEWFRIIRFIKKKFRKRKKKKITKIKFKKKKIITIRDAKVNLSKGKITYAKITKSISGIKIRIKAYWVKLRYRKFFNKHFYRWSYYKNLNNKNFHFYENLLIKIL